MNKYLKVLSQKQLQSIDKATAPKFLAACLESISVYRLHLKDEKSEDFKHHVQESIAFLKNYEEEKAAEYISKSEHFLALAQKSQKKNAPNPPQVTTGQHGYVDTKAYEYYVPLHIAKATLEALQLHTEQSVDAICEANVA